MKTFTNANRPRCTMFVHRFMGDLSICGKHAMWFIGNKPICIDHSARRLSLLGDHADGVDVDLVVIVKD